MDRPANCPDVLLASSGEAAAARVQARRVCRWLLTLLCGVPIGCSWITNAQSRRLDESRDLAMRARQAEESGRHEQAARLFIDALEADPSNAELHKKLAFVHLARGNRAAAVEQLRFASALQPDDVDTHMRLASIYHKSAAYRQAERALESVLALDAAHSGALMMQARMLEAEDEIPQANELYQRVLESEPDHPGAKLRLALYRLENSNPEQAAPLLRAVCACAQNTPEQKTEARWALGVAYGRVRRWDDAAEQLGTAMRQLRSPTADDWYRLAYARYQSGDKDRARQDARRAIVLDATHRGARQMTQRLRRESAPRTAEFSGVRYASKNFLRPRGW